MDGWSFLHIVLYLGVIVYCEKKNVPHTGLAQQLSFSAYLLSLDFRPQYFNQTSSKFLTTDMTI